MANKNEHEKRQFEYFSHQLDLAHKRNDLVDHLRFNILQIFFGFHSLIIGAILVNDKIKITIPQQLNTLLPAFVFLVGFFLFVIFFRYHIYLYEYKKWIENLERCLLKPVFSLKGDKTLDGYTGTYSLRNDKDANKPKVKLEGVVLPSLSVMTILNIGVTFSLFRLFDPTFDKCLWLTLLGFIAHIVAALLLLIRNSKI